MRCLMCGKELGYGSLDDIFIGEDPLCTQCRGAWKRKRIRFRLDGVILRSLYVYNEAFSSCLIQYKELGDEALKDVFLYEYRKQFRRRYRGYTLVLMPSSAEKEKLRGFSHLKEMFACTGLLMSEPFVKISGSDQKHRNREERMIMSSSLRLKEGVILPGKILLCDDTVTTGATIRGALNCLRGHEGKIEIFTVSANRRWLR